MNFLHDRPHGISPRIAVFTLLCALMTPCFVVFAAQPPTPAPSLPPAKVVRLTEDGLDKLRPRWSYDGKTLYYARQGRGGMDIFQYSQEADASGRLKGLPRRITDRKEPEYDGTISPDGGRLLLTIVTLSGTQGDLDLAVFDLKAKRLVKVAANAGAGLSHQEWGAWSPDGTKIAYSSTHDGNSEIYIAQADGSSVVRVTQHPGLDSHPCWSPDGKELAITTDRWSGMELARVSVDGTRIVRLTNSPGLDDYADWSPDGRMLVFVSNREHQWDIHAIAPDGTQCVNLTRHPARDSLPAWTPDGRAVTFVSNRDGGVDLYTVPVPVSPQVTTASPR